MRYTKFKKEGRIGMESRAFNNVEAWGMINSVLHIPGEDVKRKG